MVLFLNLFTTYAVFGWSGIVVFFFWNLDLFFAKNSQIFIANNWKVITNNLIFYFPDPVFKKRPIKEDLAFVEGGGGSPHTNQDPTLSINNLAIV